MTSARTRARRARDGEVRSTKRVVDPQRLRAALGRLTRRDLLVALDRALDHVPQHRVHEIVAGFVAFDDLIAPTKKRVGVLDKVKAFDEASRQGEFYEFFNVNSKNFMEKSDGTEEWIDECNRLLADLVRFSEEGGAPAEAREGFEFVFALLRRIDEGEDDIIFLADEVGSWQVDVDWPKVLPPYFRSLAATATAEEYARLAPEVIENFVRYDAEKYLSRARGAATKEQKAAMKAASPARPSPARRG